MEYLVFMSEVVVIVGAGFAFAAGVACAGCKFLGKLYSAA